MIYTKDNIVGVKFTANMGVIYEVTSVKPNGDVLVEWDYGGERKSHSYRMYLALSYLNSGDWKPTNQLTPRQQADDLLSEFVEWHTNTYMGIEIVPKQDIQDFLTHKFGE